MNRIYIRYTKRPSKYINGRHYQSSLKVYNDIKGVSSEVILKAHGHKADMLYDLLSNVDYSKLKDYMHYGYYVKVMK